MTTTTAPMTAAELLALPDDGFHRYELVMGEIIKMPPAGYEHGVIGFEFGAELRQFVKANDLGRIANSDTGFLLSTNPDTVRCPDVSFVRKERIPADGLPKGVFPGAPDIAVEVISPTDAYTAVSEKVAQYLAAGTLLVVIIDPPTRTIALHDRSGAIVRLTETDTLTLGDALPGFACPVAEIFV